MTKKIVFVISLLFLILCANVAVAEPHWTHEEQANWGAIEDTSQTEAPLMIRPFLKGMTKNEKSKNV